MFGADCRCTGQTPRTSAGQGQEKILDDVIGCSRAQRAELAAFDTPCYAEIAASWSAPNTWILPARVDAPSRLVDKNGQIAVRQTSHSQAAALCRRAGLSISTSANISGRRPARSLFSAKRAYRGGIDVYLPGTLAGQTGPSKLRDGNSGVVIRAQLY